MRSRYMWIVRGFTGNIVAGFTVKRELESYLQDKGRDIHIVRIDGSNQTVVPLDRFTLEPAEK